jgi:hypothetical protein
MTLPFGRTKGWAAMTVYRIYFTTFNGRIVGRHDFAADDDATAARIGYVLFEACSDACQAFELWEGSRKVRSRRRRRRVSSSDLTDGRRSDRRADIAERVGHRAEPQTSRAA